MGRKDPEKQNFSLKTILLIYVIFTVIWVGIAFPALAWLVADPQTLIFLQATKGLIYIIVTSWGFYLLIKKYEDRAGSDTESFPSDILAEPQKRRLYEAIMSGFPDGIFVFDLNYRVLYANEALLKIWGASLDEAIGKSLKELGYEPWQIEKSHKEMDEAVSKKQSVISEVEFEHAELGYQAASYVFVPVLGKNGEVTSVAGISHDITRRKKHEKALKESEEKLGKLSHSLEKKVRKRTAELHEKAHDLRVMSAKLAFAEHRERKRLAALLHDDLQQLLAAAKMNLPSYREELTRGAIELVNRLLDQAVDSARNLTRQLRPPAIYESGLIPALQWLASRMEERYHLQVAIDAEEIEQPLDNDDIKVLLYECIREPLFNIVKHAGVKEATVRVREEKDCLQVTIEDHGQGFDMEKIGTGTNRDGGFGLFSIRERLAALGGSLTIESAVEKGTRVVLKVPLNGSENPDGYTASSDSSTKHVELNINETKIKVLVADDHDMVREGIANLLNADSRFVVTNEAADGQEAIEILELEQPDVLLIDLNMPTMNGIEAIRKISRRWPDVTIVGMSVQGDQTTEDAMIEAGADAFVPKSGDAELMIKTIVRASELNLQSG